MRLFSYVVARDYGFAPNPFFGCCTLATCKPRIRAAANVGDWVVGTGSASKGRKGYLVYVMKVSAVMTFNEYWSSPQYQDKRPTMHGSLMQAFGDNIYHKNSSGRWVQMDSHHSYSNGRQNPHNIRNDTKIDRILVADKFAYWGGSGPKIPKAFRRFRNVDICAGRNHKSDFPKELAEAFLSWFNSINESGYIAEPYEWARLL